MQQQEMFPAIADRAISARLDPSAAKARRDSGMRRAKAHADAELGDWQKSAMIAMKHFLLTEGREQDFLAEEFVTWTRKRLYPQPPDGRAWGAIFSRARKQGLIEVIGTRRAATSNLSPKPLWTKKEQQHE